MGIPAINQLANMEYLLYGGRAGLNLNCPSSINGYNPCSMMNSVNYYNMYNTPNFRGNTNQDVFTSQNDATKVDNSYYQTQANNPQVDWSNPSYRGLSDDLNEIGKYYVDNSAPSESFLGAAVGGAAFGLVNNPRMIFHPWNSLKSTPAVEKMFASVKTDGSVLNKLWTNKSATGGYDILSEAYSRMHKLESLHNSKLGLFRKSIDDKAYTTLKNALDSALKSGDVNKIAKATEDIKKATNAFTGLIPRGLRAIGLQKPLTAVRKFINPTQYQATAEVAKKAVEEAGTKTATLGSSLKHSCGIKGGAFFAGMEFLMDWDKINSAFNKDNKTGWTQVGQTAIKGVGSAVGWAVGEGIGAWAGAKIGAAAGTAICPGVGTAIGAVAGLVGGSIGTWLMGKVTHKIIGKEAGTVAKVEEMKKTKQGQVELLQLTAPQALEDKKLSKRTLSAIQNVANYFGIQ